MGVAARCRVMVNVAETRVVMLAFGVLLGAVYVNFDAWFEPLLARGVYRDSIESSGLGFGLVNQPECDLGYIVSLLLTWFLYWFGCLFTWPNTCGSRPRLVSTRDIGIEKC